MASSTTTSVPAYQSADSWNKHAKDYKMPDTGLMSTPIASMLSAANTILPFSSPNTAFLDDGCGNGVLTAHLINHYGPSLSPTARLVATDFSSGMIEQIDARKPVETNPLWQRVETLVQDATDLSAIPSASLTHVGSSMCIFMTPTPSKAVTEAHRVLSPGGAFVWSSFKSIFHQQAIDIVKEKMGIEMASHPVPIECRSEEGVTAIMERAGFESVSTKLGRMVMPVPEDQEGFWKGMVNSGNPGFEEMLKGVTAERRNEVAEVIAAEMKKRGVKELIAETIVVLGRKPAD